MSLETRANRLPDARKSESELRREIQILMLTSGLGISSEDDSDDSDKDIQIDNAEVCRISYIYRSDG